MKHASSLKIIIFPDNINIVNLVVTMPAKSEENGFSNGVHEDVLGVSLKDIQRPAVIEEDLNEMERRKRVRQILSSNGFVEELESLVKAELAHDSLTAVENAAQFRQLTQLILPELQSRSISHTRIPIADLRGTDQGKYSKAERIQRNKLASLYRLMDLFKWSSGFNSQISLKISDEDQDRFLVNPHGLLFHEITASALLKVDAAGEIVDQGSTKLALDRSSFALHSALHAARADMECVMHIKTPVVSAVAAMKCGLLPISQEARQLGAVSYHDLAGPLDDSSVQKKIVEDLGPSNKVLILRNVGVFVCAASLEEALHLCRLLNVASETQLSAARAGVANLHMTGQIEGGSEEPVGVVTSVPFAGKFDLAQRREWKTGELEWEAWMRVLDNAGFRTGHLYKSQSYDENGCESASPHRIAALRAAQEKTRLPINQLQYQKVEILQSDPADLTAQPKKITRWISEGEPIPQAENLSAKAEKFGAVGFSPLAANPEEWKSVQRQIKDQRLQDLRSAGPQSHILECTTFDECQRIRTEAAEVAAASPLPLIGTASKAIIQREHADAAQVYKRLYNPNPFSGETDADLEAYKHEVEARSHSSMQNNLEVSGDAVPTEGVAQLDVEDTAMATEDHHNDSGAGEGKKKGGGFKAPAFLKRKSKKAETDV